MWPQSGRISFVPIGVHVHFMRQGRQTGERCLSHTLLVECGRVFPVFKEHKHVLGMRVESDENEQLWTYTASVQRVPEPYQLPAFTEGSTSFQGLEIYFLPKRRVRIGPCLIPWGLEKSLGWCIWQVLGLVMLTC